MATPAIRSLARNRRFVLTCIVVLAAGIGGNVAIFGFADYLFFRRLPVPEAGRLIGIYGERHGELCGNCISYPDYLIYREHSRTLESIAAYHWIWLWHTHGEASRELIAAAVDPSLFDILRVKPLLGRFFGEDENRVPNAHPVAVLSEHIWRTVFRADPEIAGRTARFNQTEFTIIGVAPADVRQIHGDSKIDVWLPFLMSDAGKSNPQAPQRQRYGGIDLIGRLAPGMEAAHVIAELKPMAARLAAEFPETNQDESITAVPLAGIHPFEHGDARTSAGTLAAVAACLLLIACANVAGLLLSRGAERQKEMAIRISLGAGRGALVRQLLAENLAIAIAAGILGLLFAWWMQGLIVAFRSVDAPPALPLTGGMALFALGCSAASALLFGLAPAWLTSGGGRLSALRTHSGGSRSGLRALLIAAQVAMAVVLLAGSGLLLASLERLLTQAGASADRVAAFRLRPSRIGYTVERGKKFHRTLLDRLRTVAEVESAVLARVGPSLPWCCAVPVRLPEQAAQEAREIDNNDVTPGFFATLGIPVLAGRDFDERDRAGAPRVAAVNQTLARRLWGGADPIGRELVIGKDAHRVVAVVKDTHPGRGGAGPTPYFYRSYWQQVDPDSRLFVRVKGHAKPMLPRLRREILALDPDMHVGQDRSLEETVADTYRSERMLRTLLIFSGAAALALSAMGLYAALAFAVARRRREIGIRMAVGATAGRVFALLLREGGKVALGGILAGVTASLASSRILMAHYPNLAPPGAGLYVAAALAVAVVAAAACALPARAAARVEPGEALRVE